MLEPGVHNSSQKFWLQKEISKSGTVNAYVSPTLKNEKGVSDILNVFCPMQKKFVSELDIK